MRGGSVEHARAGLKRKTGKGGERTHLIHEILTMVIAQLLCPYNAVQIGLHQLLDEVDLPEAVEVGWS